jgi:tRNA (mo5U34)-methyltransferase
MPTDLTGKTVLDVGAWDGFFSFLAEERGAVPVVAADTPEENGGHWGGATTGFDFAKKMRDSKVGFRALDIMALDGAFVNPFDVVLCYGVLYHLVDPAKAAKNLFAVTAPGGLCLIETAYLPGDGRPTWEFRQGHHNDPTNYWYPSYEGLRAVLQWAGFSGVEKIHDFGGSRMTVRAVKA